MEMRSPAAYLLFILLLAVLLAPCDAAVAGQSPRNVLLLTSYHQGDRWNDSVVQGVREALGPIESVSLSIENLDMRRYTDQDHTRMTTEYIRAKYQGRPQDLVLVSDDPALNYLLTVREDLFPNAPVVFCGVNNFTPKRIQGQSNITGVNEALSLESTLELALQLFPQTTRIMAVVSDTEASGRANLEQYRAAAARLKGRVQFDELLNMTDKDAPDILSRLPKNSLVLRLINLLKLEGGYVSIQDSIRILSTSAPVPVFTLWSFDLGDGALGGYVSSGQAQGRAAGSLAIRILEGQDADQVPVVMDSPNVPMFDQNVMDRFGINESVLPKGSVILNHQVSMLEQYWAWLLGIALFCGVQTFLILALLTRGKRLHAANAALRESGRFTRSLFEAIPVPVFHKGRDGRYKGFNKAFLNFYGKSKDELIEKSVFDITSPEIAKVHHAHDMELFEKPGIQIYPYQAKTSHGDLRDVIFHKASLTDERGSVIGLIGAILDVTEQKQAAIALQESESILRDIMETTLSGFWDWNLVANTEYLSPTFKRMFGYEDHEMENSPEAWQKIIFPEDLPGVLEVFDRHVKSRGVQPFYNEIRYRHRDGSIIWVICAGRVIEWAEDGAPIRMVGCHVDITERKRADEALLESEATFRDLFEKSADANLLIDQSRVFVECNQAALNLLKMSRAEFLNRPPVMISPEFQPDGRRSDEAAQEMIDQAYAKGLHRFDWTCVNSEGGDFIVAVSLMPILIKGQTMLHTTWRDITKRKQVETELQKSKLITDSLPVGLHLYHLEDLSDDRTLLMVYANPAVKALTSLGPEEVVGKTLDENFPGLRALGIPQRYAEVVRTQTAITFEDITYGDNRVLLASFSVNAFPLPGNMVGIAFENITERKRVDKALRLFKESVENSSDAVGMSTPEGKHYYQNKAFDELFGPIGENPPETLYVDPAIGHEVFRTIMAGGQWAGEVQMYARDRRVLAILLRAYANKDRDGRIAVLVGVHTDITERKLAEAEREKLQAQLSQAQKMESVGRLAGGVAHDFNNMLGVILGHAELSLLKIGPDEALHTNLEEIKKAAERSADLTRQLLAFARKQTVAPQMLDLNETIESALKMLRRLIGEDIDLAWLPGRNLEPIFIDASQVDQILANLCVNARDAIVGIGKVTIETENVVLDTEYCDLHAGFIPGKYIMLAVSDNGCGMDAEMLSHIFEPFYTTKEVGKGTGLGLAMVYGVVKQNNGFINVYSEPGQGTTFKIYLPSYAEKATGEVAKVPDLPTEHGHETVLLVEDEPAVLEITTMMLTTLGYTVVAAATPGEAIRLAHEYRGRMDLLMTDVVMPGMNGRELAGNLLSHYPDLKRLFMSGYTADVIAHHDVLDDGVHFIQKPFSLPNMAAKVREVLDNP